MPRSASSNASLRAIDPSKRAPRRRPGRAAARVAPPPGGPRTHRHTDRHVRDRISQSRNMLFDRCRCDIAPLARQAIVPAASFCFLRPSLTLSTTLFIRPVVQTQGRQLAPSTWRKAHLTRALQTACIESYHDVPARSQQPSHSTTHQEPDTPPDTDSSPATELTAVFIQSLAGSSASACSPLAGAFCTLGICRFLIVASIFADSFESAAAVSSTAAWLTSSVTRAWVGTM